MKFFGPLWQPFLKLFPFFVVFMASLFHPYDPDLGWHLKYGEYFFHPPAGAGRILRENIFSTEMPNYHWVNSSWMTDLISYMTFSNFGFLGLSILGAAIITLTFYFFSRAARLDFFEKAVSFPLLLYLLAPSNSVSFKGQLLSLLFTGMLIFFLREYEERKSKIIFLTIPLFALWSNIHGQFILGLAILGISIALYIAKLVTTKVDMGEIFASSRLLAAVFLASVVAACLNPFGLNIYYEALRHFGNPLQKYVAEWIAQEELSISWWKHTGVGVILFVSSLFVIFSGEFFSKLTSLVVLPFYALSFFVRRYMWTSYWLATPLISPAITLVKPESRKWAEISGSLILLIVLASSLYLNNPFKNLSNMSWESYCVKFQNCSGGAAQFLVENKFRGEIMTFYNWGGFLIWNYPEVKPNIDGRMHLWEDEGGYSAFAYYYPIEQNIEDVDSSKYSVVLMAPYKPVYKRLRVLAAQGKWRLAYEDKYAGVFVRN